MKVSFTGNYLYTFKNTQTRDKVCKEMSNLRNDMMAPNFALLSVDEDKMLLVNGEDYKDYKNAVKALQKVNAGGYSTDYAQFYAHKQKAIQVDLSDMNYSPKYTPAIKI